MDYSRVFLPRCVNCRLLTKTPQRKFYLAEKFQPKPRKKIFSFEEHTLHPTDRLNRPPKMANISNDGTPLNIGFRVQPKIYVMPKRLEAEIAQFEEKSRLMLLDIDTERAYAEFEDMESGNQILKLGQYYSIFNDLFQGAQFTNVAPLKATFANASKVYYGNILTPSEASIEPSVNLGLKSQETFYWSLVLSCPDGHLTRREGENLHWAVVNIPSNESSRKGEELVTYLPPIPFRGTGFHRYVLIAFHHKKAVRFDQYFEMLKDERCELKSRSFSTIDFYRTFQDEITPLSLAFFQSQWDQSVSRTFHARLKLKEPGFEWDGPPVYVPPYEKFPRSVDISYFEQYHPDLYTRNESETFFEGSWDKLWDREDYKSFITSQEENLDPERRRKVWRQDYADQFLDEDEAYESHVDEILKEFDYQQKKKDEPQFGYLY